MAGVSPDLIWLLVKKHNKFLYKQGGNSTASVMFTREPFNLLNKNSFKYSGLANKKAIDITSASSGPEDMSIQLATRKTRKGHTPVSSIHRQHLKKDVRTMCKTIVNQVATNGYRADLKSAALARLTAIHKSLRATKAGKKSKGKKSTSVAKA